MIFTLPRGGSLQQQGGEWKFRCPDCAEWAYLDDDQFHGRVSIDHTGCTFHETRNLEAELDDVVTGGEAP